MNALIPDVGDKAVSTEVQATSFMMKNLRISKNKIHRYGEREREAQKDVMFLLCQEQLYPITTTLTQGYKVTLYSDYLRATTLYTIYRNSPNLGYPKGECEYGHYTLVFNRFQPLTNAQRQHQRVNDLCLYCGALDHVIRHCPVRGP